jgi:Tol biopolymer transport system component
VGVSKSNGVVTGAYHIYIAGKQVIAGDSFASYQDPAWSADGTRLFFTRLGRLPGQTISHTSGLNIQMVEPDKGMSPRTVVTDATQPAPSYDGQWLAYVRINISQPPTLSKSIHIYNLLSGEDRQVISAGRFADIYGPRWMPNDSQLIFSALDPGGPPKPPPPSGTGSLLEAVDNLLGVRVAAAHAWAGDVWRVNADGTGLIQLTRRYFQTPVPAPSPDGRHIAILSSEGIWVMAADGTDLTEISGEGSNGSICWSR